MSFRVAKVAVAKATYWIDRPYDYLIPENAETQLCPGMRVKVPFSAGNRLCEGIVLSLAEESSFGKLKQIAEVLDREPVLTNEQIKLALFMREHFFCTVYEAVRTILPSGFWFNTEGRRKINDAFVEIASLCVSPEEALELSEKLARSAPQQSALLDTLAGFERIPSRELLKYAEASRATLLTLQKKDYVALEKHEIYRRPPMPKAEHRELPALSSEQQQAYDGLRQKLFTDEPSVSLLYGVTGSGKTGIYAHLIQACLKENRGAILLVPEIALTPQAISVFSSYFGDRIAVLHSSLSLSERYDEWKRIRDGEADVVIGTRSAVFAPVRNPGIIIVDEEQEDTYKSESSPRYHAVDIAKFRCSSERIPLLLGSATPNLVSMYKAREGVYSLFSLKGRYGDAQLPEVEIVDMREELLRGNGSDISTRLAEELRRNFDRGEQSILFLNRRGASKLINCPTCGYVYKCPRCSVSLTYHSVGNRLICHYCGYSRRVDERCPDCGGILNYSGTGTQLLSDELKKLFPDVEILRMDADTLAEVGSHDAVFDRFIEEKVPLLIGTQMVSKGLNFENVTLVGVISADQSLYSGDYRASEQTFSMLTQVVGRSGRGRKTGRAVIQTFSPQNDVIRFAAAQDYDSFYDAELEFRRMQNMPPFSDILRITAIGSDENRTCRCAADIAACLKRDLVEEDVALVLGPSPLPVARVNNRYRFAVNLVCHSNRKIRNYVANLITVCNKDKNYSGISIFADSNPL